MSATNEKLDRPAIHWQLKFAKYFTKSEFERNISGRVCTVYNQYVECRMCYVDSGNREHRRLVVTPDRVWSHGRRTEITFTYCAERYEHHTSRTRVAQYTSHRYRVDAIGAGIK